MRKITVCLMMSLMFAVALVGCGSANYAVTNESDTTNKVVDAVVKPADDFVVKVRSGETITVPIVIETTEDFVGFTTGIGFDQDKVEIVSSSLTVGEGSFSGMFVSNLEFQPNPKDTILFDYWQKNIDMGFNKTILMVGVSMGAYSGKTTLCAVTVKGISVGKTTLNPRMMVNGLISSNFEQLELPEMKAIEVLVEE